MKRTVPFLLALPAVLPLLLGAAGDSAPTARGEGAFQPLSDGVRTLARTLDRVSVFGEEMPGLAGRPIENLALYAARSDALEPIPFQVDERNPFGFLVLDRGAFADSDIDGGRLDENDELVFLASDAGNRVGRESWPATALSAEEIEIVDPVDGGRAWTYFFAFAGPAPERSPIDAVAYDPATDEITTPIYRVGFPADEDGNRRTYLDRMAILPDGGGKGVDILDRLKVRFETQVLFKLLTIRRNEDDFRSRILAWRDGPVRVVRRVESALHLIFGIYAQPTSVDSIYCKNSIEAPNVVDSPVNVSAFVSEVRMRGVMDLNRNAVGSRFFCPECPPEGVVLTGAMDEGKRALTGRASSWQVLAGPPEERWATLSRLAMGPTLPIEERLYFDEDLDAGDEPEFDDGHIEIGRQFLGLTKVKKGTHTLNAFLYFLPGFRMGDEKGVLDVLDRPLEVAVREEGGAPEKTAAKPEEREAEAASGTEGSEEVDPQAVFDRMAGAVEALSDYTASLSTYSSAYRGRLLEGNRTYKGRFKQKPRLVEWLVAETRYNYDDPVDEGTEAVYFGDEEKIVARGTGVKRFFGTIEVKKEDAAQWWWGESILNMDMWTWLSNWREMLSQGSLSCRKVSSAGKSRFVLTVESGRKETAALRDPRGGAASRVKIKRIRVWIDPEAGFLPVKVEGFIPGNPRPVAWVEVQELATDVGLTRSDFELGSL